MTGCLSTKAPTSLSRFALEKFLLISLMVRHLNLMTGSIGAWLALLVALSVSAGCGQSDSGSHVAAANDSNVKRLANLYQSYASRNGWQGPRDEADFKKFIREFPPHRLAAMMIDPNNTDMLFVSESDGQPFRVRYDVASGVTAVIPIVFEQQGINGRRQVGFTDGSVERVDDARYRQLLEGQADSKATDIPNPSSAPLSKGG
jgi:hypothetical protein